ncbi:MAG: response regulator [Bacteroidetes bacterium]|nr:MAG: response regulator [Bacteroidota bacterium]
MTLSSCRFFFLFVFISIDTRIYADCWNQTGNFGIPISIPLNSIPFYNSTWFLLLSISLVVLISFLLYQSGMKKLTGEKEEEVSRRSTRLKEQFLANMSHEFRTPLNAIVGMTRLLSDNNPKPDQINYLNAISKSSENLMAIINDILDITKIEAGRIQLYSIPFEIKPIIQSLYDNFILKAQEKNIRYKVSIDESVPPVLVGDPLRLVQILSNVINNAIKFTDEGVVELNCTTHGYSKSDGNSIRLFFSIKDTGIGIAANNMESVFDSFSQEVSDTTRKFGGAGLGLSISKKLVELYQGSIHVESKSGEGSTFTIDLPFQLYEGKELNKTEIHSNPELRNAIKGISVLLVEDIEFNRIVALDTLTTEVADVKVDIAKNGLEAVALASEKMYDIVLMDLQMPELNGYDASRQIRLLPKPNCDMPIIAMTASALEDEIYRCYEAGMNDFITKPFDTNILFRKILNQIQKEKV